MPIRSPRQPPPVPPAFRHGRGRRGAVLLHPAGGDLRSSLPADHASFDTRSPIKQAHPHLMLENRSFDNLFGKFPGVNGATTGVAYGQDKQPRIGAPHWMPAICCIIGAAALNCMNGGAIRMGSAAASMGPVYGYRSSIKSAIPESPPVGTIRLNQVDQRHHQYRYTYLL